MSWQGPRAGTGTGTGTGTGDGSLTSQPSASSSSIKLDITFEIDEVVIVSPTVAYARARSQGKTIILAADAQVAEGNQELFVLFRRDEHSEWQIGRYIFSTTMPRG